MTLVLKNLAARYHQTGLPAEVVEVEKLSLPPPGKGEVRVKMLYAPINPADLNMLEGKYGEARSLPDVPGNEGVGRVEAAGEGSGEGWLGQYVLVDRQAWQEEGNWKVDHLIKVPQGLDPRQAAMLRINPPTAWLLLHHFTSLSSGDWVVQNAATSGVGKAVIEIAKSSGWRTLNLIRRVEAAEGLQTLGADAVLVDGPEMAAQAKEVLLGHVCRLGLNAVGGSAATRLAGLLEPGGALLTYGAMSREAVKIPNGFLIFRDLHFQGFWLTRWLSRASDKEVDKVFREIFRLAATGCFQPSVAQEFPLVKVKEAVALAAGGVSGKVLLKF